MKKYIVVMLIVLVMGLSCGLNNAGFGSSTYDRQGTVTSDTKTSAVEKFVLIFQIKITDATSPHSGLYLVAPQIMDIELYFNSQLWGKGDTPLKDVLTVGTADSGFRYSTEVYNYYAIIEYMGLDGDYVTAQDYSNYLNGTLGLGEYVLEITNMTAIGEDDQKIIFNPNVIMMVKVEEDQESISLGSFTEAECFEINNLEIQ